ncbi:glycosyltransferase [Candidatus Desantisbacteria bacterium]|nr:glycosyltransferase [Candidatus Desantisbacteria bacterium]
MEMGKSEFNVKLRMSMRKLWEEHIVYTRNYIISALADLKDSNAVAERLLKNQDDIGDAIKQYYGKDAGNQLAVLLRSHILIATEVVKAAKDGDSKQLDKANKRWYTNADEITTFLGNANSFWKNKDIRDMLYKHLELTTGEVVSRIKNDWKADINYYDKGHSHMLMFADALTEGIEKQFPDKFKK